MSGPCVEVLKFTATEVYKAQPYQLFKPILEIILGRPGSLKAYCGLQKEDPNIGYCIVVWETYEAHKAMMDDEDTYKRLLSYFAPCFVGEIEMHHIFSNVNPIKALDAPLTRITRFAPHEPCDASTISSLVERLTRLDTKIHLAAYGNVMEHKNDVVLFVGLESTEDSATGSNSSEHSNVLAGFAAASTSIHVYLTAHH